MKKKFSKIMSAFLAGAMLLSTAPVRTFAAVASDLPDNMADSAILRALEYTGYDVQKQKNDGTLYQPGSFGSSAPASVLSDISYGLSLTGKETVSGSKAEWKEVLTVYSVKVNTDADNPQEVVTMDEGKRQLLKDIFWEMNSISSRTESKEETVVTESNDGNGNVVRTETTVTKTYLYITVSHRTADEMAVEYGFSEEQREMIEVLLREENVDLWEGWEK